MVHAYHVVIAMYGFRLPSNTRGSWSDFVRNWELVLNTKSTNAIENADKLKRYRDSLTYPAISLTGEQALTIANGFARFSRRNRLAIYACSILPEHTHLVIGRHRYHVEQVINLLKGAATTEAIEQGNHPLAEFAEEGKRPPRMWSAKQWKVYLDSEQAIDDAIKYVVDNPSKEDKPKQNWSFITPFTGVSKGGWTTYH